MASQREAQQPVRMLVGFDGSEGAYDAVALARNLGPGSTVVLAYVVPHEDPLAHHYKLLAPDDPPVAQGFFDRAVATLDGFATELRSYVGASPAHVLCDLADDEDVDMVVVGSPHRSALGRALIGSVAEALTHGSRVPVALAPRGYAETAPDSLRAIAVAYDGTPESDAALRQAEGIALATGASLEVLTVVGPSAVVPKVLIESRSPIPEPYAVVEEAVAGVDQAVEVHAHELIGPIAEAVANACKDVDLLIAGSRDYGPLKRVLVGSVSSRLIHTAPCPVLVVPRPT